MHMVRTEIAKNLTGKAWITDTIYSQLTRLILIVFQSFLVFVVKNLIFIFFCFIGAER